MDCISRGKREKGRFVAKGKPNFLAAKYFPTRHLGGGGGGGLLKFQQCHSASCVREKMANRIKKRHDESD